MDGMVVRSSPYRFAIAGAVCVHKLSCDFMVKCEMRKSRVEWHQTPSTSSVIVQPKRNLGFISSFVATHPGGASLLRAPRDVRCEMVES
jgi:hypothetical protein